MVFVNPLHLLYPFFFDFVSFSRFGERLMLVFGKDRDFS